MDHGASQGEMAVMEGVRLLRLKTPLVRLDVLKLAELMGKGGARHVERRARERL